MSINTLIVDDEPQAQHVISSYLEKMEGFEIAGLASNAVQAFQILQEKNIDLIFLDIKMPKINGIDFIRSLRHPPRIILTTAYREFALDGYDLDVVDFLLKPISMERFLKAVSKVYEIKPVSADSNKPLISQRSFIYVKSDRKMVKIFLDEVQYIESIKDYVKIFLSDRIIITKQQIGFLEKILPSDDFVRIHRSYIISLSKVEAYTPSHIELKGKSLPIGNLYKDSTLESLKIQ